VRPQTEASNTSESDARFPRLAVRSTALPINGQEAPAPAATNGSGRRGADDRFQAPVDLRRVIVLATSHGPIARLHKRAPAIRRDPKENWNYDPRTRRPTTISTAPRAILVSAVRPGLRPLSEQLSRADRCVVVERTRQPAGGREQPLDVGNGLATSSRVIRTPAVQVAGV
jgi:hypothetical protein